MYFQPQRNTLSSFNLAPLVDFLFLLLVIFATLATARNQSSSEEIELATLRPTSLSADAPMSEKSASNKDLAAQSHYKTTLVIKITRQGEYLWSTQRRDYPLKDLRHLCQELTQQSEHGLISEPSYTLILFKVDRLAPWESVARAIFETKRRGYHPRPTYELDPSN